MVSRERFLARDGEENHRDLANERQEDRAGGGGGLLSESTASPTLHFSLVLIAPSPRAKHGSLLTGRKLRFREGNKLVRATRLVRSRTGFHSALSRNDQARALPNLSGGPGRGQL